MKIATVGLDIAKQVFQVHGADSEGRAVLRKRLRRDQVTDFFPNLPPCLVGLEACCGSHYWARVLSRFGHTVRLIAPQFVKPYVKSNKNDANDAETICEAVSRPQMRNVPAKSAEQQDIQSLHRVRSRLVSSRTQLASQTRGLLAEYGIVLPQCIGQLRCGLPLILENAENELTNFGRRLFASLYEELVQFDNKIEAIDEKPAESLRRMRPFCRAPAAGDSGHGLRRLDCHIAPLPSLAQAGAGTSAQTDRALRDAQLASYIGRRSPGFELLERPNHLRFAEFRLQHSSPFRACAQIIYASARIWG